METVSPYRPSSVCPDGQPPSPRGRLFLSPGSPYADFCRSSNVTRRARRASPLQCIAGRFPLYFPTKEAIMVIFFDIDGTIIDDATQGIPASAASSLTKIP